MLFSRILQLLHWYFLTVCNSLTITQIVINVRSFYKSRFNWVRVLSDRLIKMDRPVNFILSLLTVVKTLTTFFEKNGELLSPSFWFQGWAFKQLFDYHRVQPSNFVFVNGEFQILIWWQSPSISWLNSYLSEILADNDSDIWRFQLRKILKTPKE